jgi:hypothetical protein
MTCKDCKDLQEQVTVLQMELAHAKTSWTPDSSDDMKSAVAAGMTELIDFVNSAMQPAWDATEGYRARIEELDFPEDTVTLAVAHYHVSLMRMVTTSLINTMSGDDNDE